MKHVKSIYEHVFVMYAFALILLTMATFVGAVVFDQLLVGFYVGFVLLMVSIWWSVRDSDFYEED